MPSKRKQPRSFGISSGWIVVWFVHMLRYLGALHIAAMFVLRGGVACTPNISLKFIWRKYLIDHIALYMKLLHALHMYNGEKSLSKQLRTHIHNRYIPEHFLAPKTHWTRLIKYPPHSDVRLLRRFLQEVRVDLQVGVSIQDLLDLCLGIAVEYSTSATCKGNKRNIGGTWNPPKKSG